MDARNITPRGGDSRPDFLVIGAARSATTALCDSLAQHPDVFMCVPKEPHFFAMQGRRPDFRGPGDEAMINSRTVFRPDDYLSLFDGCADSHVAGEGSVSSLYYGRAAQRIRSHVPRARLICILRDPSERAWSAFQYMRSRCYEPLDDCREALRDEPRRIRENWHHIWHYREMGFYHRQLSVYFELFDREQILVLMFDDFRQDHDEVLARCFRHLGVNHTYQAVNRPSGVVSGEPKRRRLGKLLARQNPIKDIMRPLVPRSLRQAVWRRIARANLRKKPIPADVRAELAAGYRTDILRLQELLDRDLSSWLE